MDRLSSAAPANPAPPPRNASFESPAVPEPRPAAVGYRLGEGALDVLADDVPLLGRLETLFGDCRSPSVCAPRDRRVRCVVERTRHGLVAVDFDDPSPLDHVAFLTAVFGDRRYAPHSMGLPRRSLLVSAVGAPAICVEDDRRLVVRIEDAWRPVVAGAAVCRTLRLQRDVVYLHAAGVAHEGRGVAIVGPKGSGKSTLALGLGARGWTVLSDELVGIHLGDRRLLGIPRAVSVRCGPRAAGVDEALAGASPIAERFPNGELRQLARLSALFPDGDARADARLAAIVFLRELGDRPVLARTPPGAQSAPLLTPLAATLWDLPPALRALRLLQTLSLAPTFTLKAGAPDATVEAVASGLHTCLR